jgi:hypothetical protein
MTKLDPETAKMLQSVFDYIDSEIQEEFEKEYLRIAGIEIDPDFREKLDKENLIGYSPKLREAPGPLDKEAD